MNAFIEQNKSMLKKYCITARIIGWILLLNGSSGAIWFYSDMISSIQSPERQLFKALFFSEAPWQMLGLVTTGIFVLGIGQLLRFLTDEDPKPGWILRNAKRLLGIYIVCIVISFIIGCGYTLNYEDWTKLFGHTIVFVLSRGTKIFLLYGLVHILRLIIPVIEESRTLV
jgi:hypothetical protein